MPLSIFLAIINNRRKENIASARQATLPRGSFWRAKLTTSDELGNFLSHVTPFHNLHMTLTTSGNDILMTLKTHCEDTLMTPMTCCEDTLTASVTTHDYRVTTQNDVTDDPCGNIDNLVSNMV